MKVTILGTGTAIPTGDRYQTSLVVESPDASRPLLVDCGAGTIHRLDQAGYDLTSFDAILLTHHHLDHVADLPSFLKARVLLDVPECTIVGPAGTREYLSSLLDVDRIAERSNLEFREPDGPSFSVDGYDIDACETIHSVPGYAYRINDAFTFSGDTEASTRIAELASGSDVLLHDCSFVEENRANHATPTSLGNTLAGIDLDHLFLTHLYPRAAAETETILQHITRHVDFPVDVAQDLEGLKIPVER